MTQVAVKLTADVAASMDVDLPCGPSSSNRLSPRSDQDDETSHGESTRERSSGADAEGTIPDDTHPGEDVQRLVSDHHARLSRMHPGTADPELATWFIIEAPDEESARELAAALIHLDGVEAAYEQEDAAPPDLLP